MSTTLPDLAPDQWLKSLYSNDGTLQSLISGRVYPDIVPQDANGNPQESLFPCIVYRLYLPHDTGTVNSSIFMLYNDYVIVAAVRSAFIRDAEPIAARIMALTHNATSASVSRGQIYGAVRLTNGAFRQGYRTNGVEYRELGGIFRVFSQASY